MNGLGNKIIEEKLIERHENHPRLVFLFGLLSFITAPFWFLRFFNFNFVLSDVLMFLLGLVLIYHCLAIRFKPIIFYIASAVFIIAATMAILNSPLPFKAITGTLQYLFILFFLFPIIYNLLNYDLYQKYIKALCKVWAFFILFNLFFLSNPLMYDSQRFKGFYGNPIDFGLILAVMLPLMINSAYMEKKIKWKILILLAVLTSIIFLLISGSRGSILAAFIGIGVFIILINGISFRSIRKLFLSLLLVTLILISIMPHFPRNAFSRVFLEENIETRLQQYGLSYQLFPNVFFLGYGLHASGELIAQHGGDFRPHNFFIDIFLETGFFGFIAFVIIIWLCLGWGIKLLLISLFKNIKVNSLVAATFSSGLILFLATQVSTTPVHRGLWIFFAFNLWMATQKNFFDKKNY
jgi:O-antigen ligase